MRIAVAATPSIALPSLDWLLASDHQLEFVISKPDSPVGRGKVVSPSEVSKWCFNHDVQVFKPIEIASVLDRLSTIDLLITIGYGVILPPAIYQSPRKGAINLHFSLLPAWRGAAPVQRGIEAGDSEGGVSVFALDEGMDTGPIYVQERMKFAPDQSAGEILSELARLGPQALQQTLEMISREEDPTAQPRIGASHARKISRKDARIDWESPSHQIKNQIRAFNPEPGAWTIWRGGSFQIFKAENSQNINGLAPGQIQVQTGSVSVGCGAETVLEILDVIPPGKRLMSAESWANGARISVGESFG